MKWKKANVGDKGQLWQMKESIFFRFQQKHRSKGEIKSGENEQARWAFCESHAVLLHASKHKSSLGNLNSYL